MSRVRKGGMLLLATGLLGAVGMAVGSCRRSSVRYESGTVGAGEAQSMAGTGAGPSSGGAGGTAATPIAPAGGGSGGIPAASGDPGFDNAVPWLDDASAWEPVNAGSDCLVYAARPDRLPNWKRSWSACGPGCQQASALVPVAVEQMEVKNATAAQIVDGTAYLGVFAYWSEGANKSRGVSYTSRLSDGAIAAAVQFRHSDQCSPLAAFRDAPGVFTAAAAGQVRAGRAPLVPGATIHWAPKLADLPSVATAGFATHELWGVAGLGGGIRIQNWSDGSVHFIDPLTDTYYFAARDDIVAWPEYPTPHARLMAYWPADHKRAVLLSDPVLDLTKTATSPERLVWLAETGPEVRSGAYQSAALYWSAFAPGATSVKPVKGPDIPADNGLTEIETGGDYAATFGGTTSADGGVDNRIFVVQLSTGKLWTLHEPPGKQVLRVLAVSDQQILLGAVDWPGTPYSMQEIQYILRIDPAKLDELEAAW